MCAAAEFLAEVAAYRYDTNLVSVFFTEERCGACLFRIFETEDFRGNVFKTADDFIGTLFDLLKILCGNSLKVIEVESQTVRRNTGTRLRHVVSQNFFQSRVENMRGSMVSGDIIPVNLIDFCRNGCPFRHTAGFHRNFMNVQVLCLSGIVYDHSAVCGFDHAPVAGLSAHLRIKWRTVENYRSFISRRDAVRRFSVFEKSDDCTFVRQSIVSGKDCRFLRGEEPQFLILPRDFIVGFSGRSRFFFLLFHTRQESFFIRFNSALLQNFHSEFQRKTVSIVKFEYFFSFEGRLSFFFQLFDAVADDTGALVDGFTEFIFFDGENLKDVVLPFLQSRICFAGHFDDALRQSGHEFPLDSQQSSVSCGSSQQSSEHVAPALVARNDTVADHKCHRTDMIRDDTDRNIFLRSAAFVRDTGELCHAVQNVFDRIDGKNGVCLLHDAGHSLQSHAGIDIRMFQRIVIALFVTVELCKHMIPEFDISVAVAAGLTVRASAAVLRPSVEVDLGARSARPDTDFPEIVVFSQPHDALFRHSNLISPQSVRFIVVLIDGRPNPFFRKLEPFCNKFPSPLQ